MSQIAGRHNMQEFNNIPIKKINKEEGMAKIVERYKKLYSQIKEAHCKIVRINI